MEFEWYYEIYYVLSWEFNDRVENEFRNQLKIYMNKLVFCLYPMGVSFTAIGDLLAGYILNS